MNEIVPVLFSGRRALERSGDLATEGNRGGENGTGAARRKQTEDCRAAASGEHRMARVGAGLFCRPRVAAIMGRKYRGPGPWA